MVQKETLSSLTHGNFAKELSISQGKVPPNAVEFEKLVIGTFLIDKKGLDHSIDLLKPEVFYDPRHQEIFRAILKLYENNHPVDMVTVIQELKRTEKLSLAGGDHYIIDLTTGVSSSAHIEYHVRIILEKYILRSLINVSANVIDSSYKESTDVFELLDKAEQGFFEITNGTIKKGFDTANSLVKEAIDKIKALKDKEGLSGIPSGFRDVDKETGGWQNSDLIIIAARPAMGKTAFVVSMAKYMAVDHGIPVALFNLEMSAVQLVKRLLSNVCEIDGQKIKSGRLSEEEWGRLNNRIGTLESAPLFINDTPSLSVFELRTKARRLVREHQVKIIIIDYLQLMNASGMSFGNREQEVSTISRSLKMLAKELNIPIIALSQLNRGVENRLQGGDANSKRPQLSDLRESGAIEQDADIVCFIHRPEYYKITVDPETGESLRGVGEFIIAKHRNGPVGEVRLAFKADYARFAPKSELAALNPGGEGANKGKGVSLSGRTLSSAQPSANTLATQADPLSGSQDFPDSNVPF